MSQKSRNLWISEGDNNTAYFHNCIKARINSNKILSLIRDDNTVLFEVPQIQNEAISYFRNHLNVEAATSSDELDLTFMEGNILSQSQLLELIKPVTREEVKQVLFSMDSRKAPGPNGFNVYFFKQAWQIVGEDFMDAIQHFFIKVDS